MRPVALCLAVLIIMFAGSASAQVPTSGNVFFGYSFDRTGSLGGNNVNLNGWNASLEGKVLPWVGLVADFAAGYGSTSTGCAVSESGQQCFGLGHVSEYNIVFGPRVSFSAGKIRPFAEALFGAGHINTDTAGSDTSFSTALGGGVDVKIIRPVAWRLEGDYLQARFFGSTQGNFRFSTGIVVRF
jgi:hypothetical protein